MYARVFSAQIQSGKLDDVTQLVQSSIIPAAKTQHGFKGLLLLTDPGTGKAMIVSQWATEADRAASENNGFLREQLAKLSAFVAGPPSTERFEISAHA
jgi:heme-degrading monooxygenase HmoA